MLLLLLQRMTWHRVKKYGVGGRVHEPPANTHKQRPTRATIACSLSVHRPFYVSLLSPIMGSRQDKVTTEKHARTLRDLLKRPENKVCADCKRNGASP